MDNETPATPATGALLGFEAMNYGAIEVGKWKPKEGYAEYAFINERVEIRTAQGDNGTQKTYKVLCVTVKPAYEAKIRTMEFSYKDNPSPKTNFGKWVSFVKESFDGKLERGANFGIFRKNDPMNPNWAILEFSRPQGPVSVLAPEGVFRDGVKVA